VIVGGRAAMVGGWGEIREMLACKPGKGLTLEMQIRNTQVKKNK